MCHCEPDEDSTVEVRAHFNQSPNQLIKTTTKKNADHHYPPTIVASSTATWQSSRWQYLSGESMCPTWQFAKSTCGKSCHSIGQRLFYTIWRRFSLRITNIRSLVVALYRHTETGSSQIADRIFCLHFTVKIDTSGTRGHHFLTADGVFEPCSKPTATKEWFRRGTDERTNNQLRSFYTLVYSNLSDSCTYRKYETYLSDMLRAYDNIFLGFIRINGNTGSFCTGNAGEQLAVSICECLCVIKKHTHLSVFGQTWRNGLSLPYEQNTQESNSTTASSDILIPQV